MASIQVNSGTIGQICTKCNSLVEHFARFCGECGSPGHLQPLSSPQNMIASKTTETDSRHLKKNETSANPVRLVTPNHTSFNEQQESARAVPKFAHLAGGTNQTIDPKMKEELGSLFVLLARERLFLYMHCAIFLVANLIGFAVSIKAYTELNADELTRTVIALAPLFLINLVAALSLVPIKGTKREIARLKEQIAHLRFQIEYKNIF